MRYASDKQRGRSPARLALSIRPRGGVSDLAPPNPSDHSTNILEEPTKCEGKKLPLMTEASYSYQLPFTSYRLQTVIGNS